MKLYQKRQDLIRRKSSDAIRRILFVILVFSLIGSFLPLNSVRAVKIDDIVGGGPIGSGGGTGPGGTAVTFLDIPIPDRSGNILSPTQTFRKVKFQYEVTNVLANDPTDVDAFKSFERYILHEVRPAVDSTIPVNVCNARSYALGYTLKSTRQDEVELNSEDQESTGQTDMPFQISSFLNLAGDIERSDREKYSTLVDLPDPPGGKGEITRWDPSHRYQVTVSWESFPPPDTADESTIAYTTIRDLTAPNQNDIDQFGENVGVGRGQFIASFRTLIKGKFRFGAPVLRLGTEPDLSNRVFPSAGADYSDITTLESEVVAFNPNEYVSTCTNPRVVERLYNTCTCQFVGSEKFTPGAPPRYCETTKVPMVDAAEFWPPWVLKIHLNLFSPIPLIETHTKVNSFNDIMAIMAILGDAQRREEKVEVMTSPRNPMPGEKTTISASPNGFDTTRGYYSNFCLDGISQQGALAGGSVRTAFELNDNGDALVDAAGERYPLIFQERTDGRTCCNPITRRPHRDIDGDGIDDDWETFYVEKMKTLFGQDAITTFLDDRVPPTRWENIPAEGEFSDLDGDGYLAHDFQQKGQVDPATGQPLLTYFNNAPNAKRYSDSLLLQSGDGSFTNLEEYLWGTDPTEKDTDGDGYPDEADIVGFRQNTMEFPFMKVARKFTADVFGLPGDRHQLRITMLGGSTKQRDQGKKRVTIGSQSQFIYARPAQELGISVVALPSSPRFYTPFTLRIDGNDPNYPLDTLNVKWFFTNIDHLNADPVTQPDQFISFPPSGAADADRSRVILNLGGTRGGTAPDDRLSIESLSESFVDKGWNPLTPGITIVAKAVVYDSRYVQLATSGTLFALGEKDISFSYCQPSPEDGICSITNDADITPDDPTNLLYTGPENTKSVMVEIELSDAYDAQKEDLLYEWEINGQKVERSCGPDGAEMCGIGSYRLKFLPLNPPGEPYTIGVGVYDQQSHRILETVVSIPTYISDRYPGEGGTPPEDPLEIEEYLQETIPLTFFPESTRRTIGQWQASIADYLADPWMRTVRWVGIFLLGVGLAFGGVRLGKILGSVS